MYMGTGLVYFLAWEDGEWDRIVSYATLSFEDGGIFLVIQEVVGMCAALMELM